MPARRDLTVVKLGGSYAFSAHLADWIDAVASCAGRVVLVTGGGPFADAVRAAQVTMGFDDRAAHHMALLAMSQCGCAIASRRPGFRLAGSPEEILRAIGAGQVPVWSPVPMALGAPDLPESWDVTSDSLSAWLAARLDVPRLLLVKHWHAAVSPGLDQLVAARVVDPVLPSILGACRIAAYIAGPADHGAAAAAIRAGAAPGVRVLPDG